MNECYRSNKCKRTSRGAEYTSPRKKKESLPTDLAVKRVVFFDVPSKSTACDQAPTFSQKLVRYAKEKAVVMLDMCYERSQPASCKQLSRTEKLHKFNA